jgi:hypothetical protein
MCTYTCACIVACTSAFTIACCVFAIALVQVGDMMTIEGCLAPTFAREVHATHCFSNTLCNTQGKIIVNSNDQIVAWKDEEEVAASTEEDMLMLAKSKKKAARVRGVCVWLCAYM